MTNSNLHAVALVNITDGTVQGHAAGCADLTRGTLRRHADEVWNLEVSSKHEAWDAYNSDFINEHEHDEDCDLDAARCLNAYDIDWKPCAKHVPAKVEEIEGVTVETTVELVETEEPTVTTALEVKRGPKWTYIFVNGEQVMEVRSHLADQVLATVNFFA